MTEEELEELSERIDKKVFKMGELKKDKEEEKILRGEVFQEGTEFLICKSCPKYKDSEDLPHLRKSKSQGLGFISCSSRTVNSLYDI